MPGDTNEGDTEMEPREESNMQGKLQQLPAHRQQLEDVGPVTEPPGMGTI